MAILWLIHFFILNFFFKKNYLGLIIGGLIAGAGIAVFPMISNVVFWNKENNSGWMQNIFGGVGNFFPGVFQIVIPILV